MFIHREQGFGDAIQFARLIPAIKEKFGGTILLETPPELMRLFQQIDGVDQLVPSGKPPPVFDYWVPLMSLGHILHIREDNIPGKTPYLHKPEDHPLRLHPAPKGGMNIGIVWAGSPTHQNDRRRSVPLDLFLPLANDVDTRLFSLQKGPACKELITTGANCIIVDAGKDLKDFTDSAALIDQLDLVITVDTSVAHLAGAMGKEVWVLLPFTPDWRWMWHRTDSPWYPDMRLFRQDHPGDWEGSFKKLYRALDEKRLRLIRKLA